MSCHGLLLKDPKTKLYKDLFFFPLEFQLTRINVIVIIFKFTFDETAKVIYKTKNIRKCSKLPPITLFCLKKPIPSIKAILH